MTVTESVDLLRGRYIRHLKGKDEHGVAHAIGVHRNTLLSFRHGASLKISTLQLIEAWCEHQERGER